MFQARVRFRLQQRPRSRMIEIASLPRAASLLFSNGISANLDL
jgi:hypothetical protein